LAQKRAIRLNERAAAVLDDMRATFELRRFANLLAWRDLTSSTRLSQLGQVWLLINPTLWILTMVIFFGPQLGAQEPRYALYAATGAVIYLAIQTMATEGARVFTAERSIILNVPVPYFVFVMKLLFKALFSLTITSCLIIIAMLYDQPPVTLSILLVFPALIVTSVAGFGVILILGVIGTRYFDLHLIVQATMRVVMFVTPVFWLVPAHDSLRSKVANLNPIYHFIEILRAPIMGQPVSPHHWIYASAFAIGAFCLGIFLFARFRTRLALWI
jgi:ABC-2 type transport system permease protein